MPIITKAGPENRKEKPLISVIVAVLNSADTVGRCLSSVSVQTYPHFELLVIDGGSDDGTLEEIKRYRPWISYLESGPDQGIFHAWNKALKRMRGDWACFLGADDYLWSSDVFGSIAPALEGAFPAFPVVYMNAAGVLDGEVAEWRGCPWDRKRFFDTMYFSHQGVMHHRSLFERYGAFDQSFRIAGDYDFLLRCLRHEEALYLPDSVLSAYTVCGLSNAVENAGIVPAEARRARTKNGAAHLSLPWLRHAVLCKLWKLASAGVGRSNANRLADLYRVCIGKKPIYSGGDRRSGGTVARKARK